MAGPSWAAVAAIVTSAALQDFYVPPTFYVPPAFSSTSVDPPPPPSAVMDSSDPPSAVMDSSEVALPTLRRPPPVAATQ
jgi:hypothetical protein